MSYEKVSQVRSRLIIGTKQTLKAMKNGNISEVYVADDADAHVNEKVIQLAQELNIPCEHVASKKKLGAACGIEVGASVVGIQK